MKPKSERPRIPGYGIEKSDEGMIAWEQVSRWMKESQCYWISTTNRDGSPHAIPIWGIWMDDQLYFGGGSTTQWAKNLGRNPKIVGHTESGQNVVITEGTAELKDEEKLNKKLSKFYKEKYGIEHPPPFWTIRAEKIFSWTIEDYAKTPTKWQF